LNINTFYCFEAVYLVLIALRTLESPRVAERVEYVSRLTEDASLDLASQADSTLRMGHGFLR